MSFRPALLGESNFLPVRQTINEKRFSELN